MEKKLRSLEEDISKSKAKDTKTTGSKLEVKAETTISKSDDIEGSIKKQFGKELELIALIGRRERISHNDIAKRVKDDA